jgi:hypothetical protein
MPQINRVRLHYLVSTVIGACALVIYAGNFAIPSYSGFSDGYKEEAAWRAMGLADLAARNAHVDECFAAAEEHAAGDKIMEEGLSQFCARPVLDPSNPPIKSPWEIPRAFLRSGNVTLSLGFVAAIAALSWLTGFIVIRMLPAFVSWLGRWLTTD